LTPDCILKLRSDFLSFYAEYKHFILKIMEGKVIIMPFVKENNNSAFDSNFKKFKMLAGCFHEILGLLNIC